MTPRLDAFGLVVRDLPASLAFYRLLGLDVPPDAGDLCGVPHAEAALPGGGRLLWDTEESVRSFDPHGRWTDGGRVSLAFRCADPGEVDAVFERLTGAGYRGRLKPWDAVWGQRYAVVLDPDGTEVALYADSGAAGPSPA